MFMSLFFFGLTLVFYGLSHWCARSTRPNRQIMKLQQSRFFGDIDNFKNQLQSLVSTDPRLSIVETQKNYILIDEKPGFLTYGNFYHITWHSDDDCLLINFCVQGKLFQQRHKNYPLLEVFKQQLELQDVG